MYWQSSSAGMHGFITCKCSPNHSTPLAGQPYFTDRVRVKPQAYAHWQLNIRLDCMFHVMPTMPMCCIQVHLWCHASPKWCPCLYLSQSFSSAEWNYDDCHPCFEILTIPSWIPIPHRGWLDMVSECEVKCADNHRVRDNSSICVVLSDIRQ